MNNILRSESMPQNRVVILGAGMSVRGKKPSALVHIDDSNRVLDWIINSFSVLSSPQIDFVAGYKADEISKKYPTINYTYSPDWSVTGPIHSLARAPLASKTATYICYADSIFRKDAIREMEACEAEVVIAIDSLWRQRYASPSQSDIIKKEKVHIKKSRVVACGDQLAIKTASQFTGLIKISNSVLKKFQTIVRSGQFSDKAKLSELIQVCLKNKITIKYVDLCGDWTELDAPQDLAQYVLGTKAESLKRLKPLLHKGEILEQINFSLKSWKEEPDKIIKSIQSKFNKLNIIVRSSALSEDCWNSSSAGAYKSIMNVASENKAILKKAIEEVFDSYSNPILEDQVLIQQMLHKVAISGVIMTRTPSFGSPYYVINFDSQTQRTDSVTSGDGKSLRTVILHRDSQCSNTVPKSFPKLIEAIKEIELFVGHDSLDIEFAITPRNKIYIFQVRPIAVSHLIQPIDDINISKSIVECKRYYREQQKRTPFLFGKNTVYSVMSDWNPAEMIGTKPNRLAFSLYRYLITDETWAKQRVEYGYKDVRPMNLIVDFLGHPYIDLRVDFNSFLPKDLPNVLSEKLVNYYLKELIKSPELHDKVEFDIIFSCMSFDFDEKSKSLSKANFTSKDIALLKDQLIGITNNGIKRCAKDLINLKRFDERYNQFVNAGMAPLELAYLLLEEVRRKGILIFSHLARNGFVAASLLSSLRAINCITEKEKFMFLSSINTVSQTLQSDGRKVAQKKLSWNKFVNKYGHLRPGAYDITSVCYANASKEYLLPIVKNKPSKDITENKYEWSKKTKMAIEAALKKANLDISESEFTNFLRSSIEGRELAKFSFTKYLNAALENIATFGDSHNVSREKLSHIRVKDILELRAANPDSIQRILSRHFDIGSKAHDLTQSVCLPSCIFSQTDFVCMEHMQSEPNYITMKKISAPVVTISKQSNDHELLSDRIVVIMNADPGYDWLFAHNIKGLITMYGGVNSHMAIRAAEYQLPAAIGVGELMFESINQAEVIELNCSSRQIKIIRKLK